MVDAVERETAVSGGKYGSNAVSTGMSASSGTVAFRDVSTVAEVRGKRGSGTDSTLVSTTAAVTNCDCTKINLRLEEGEKESGSSGEVDRKRVILDRDRTEGLKMARVGASVFIPIGESFPPPSCNEDVLIVGVKPLADNISNANASLYDINLDLILQGICIRWSSILYFVSPLFLLLSSLLSSFFFLNSPLNSKLPNFPNLKSEKHFSDSPPSTSSATAHPFKVLVGLHFVF